MKKFLVTALLLAAFSAVLPAKAGAEAIDMKTVTCEALLSMNEDGASFMLIWLDGYLSGISGDTRMDPAAFDSFSDRMVSACTKSPGAAVLDIAKVVGLQ